MDIPCSGADAAPSILGVEVRRYKNLHEVWLPWGEGLALFGANGAGKTNLIECLALLMGSASTLAQARPRLILPEPDALSLVARVRPDALPWSPDMTVHLAERQDELPRGSGVAVFERAAADGRWWAHLGVSEGADSVEGIANAGLPSPVTELLQRAFCDPVIRYTLRSIELGPPQSRVFSRTLVAAEVRPGVFELADQLPDLFAPLRSAVGAAPGPSGFVPLLELPPASATPTVLQWLSGGRTSEDANEDLVAAFERASDPVSQLAGALSGLPVVRPPGEGDWHWWLHELGQRWGNEELADLVPGVRILAQGGGDADFAFQVAVATHETTIAETREPTTLEPFSAGERRWVDEALGTVARQYERFADQAEQHWQAFFSLDEEDVLAALREVIDVVDEIARRDEYWPSEVFDLILQTLEPHLVAAELKILDANDNALVRALILEGRPGLGQFFEPRVVVRVFDEPEAHLHVTAQQRVANALERLRRAGQNVVIASHSPAFLDLPGWTQIHLHASDEGSTATVLPDGSRAARRSLARQLGVNTGELIAGINGILIVEGPHDQLVLDAFFGEDLRTARVAVVRMFGTENLPALAELDFIDRYLDVPLAVMLDYTRVDRVRSGSWRTSEERKLVDLRSRRRAQAFSLVGLDRPDIVCYLSESAVRDLHASFPGWAAVIHNFERIRIRPRFKPWLFEQFGVDLRTSTRIREVLECMATAQHHPVGELTRKVNELLGGWPTSPLPTTPA